MATDIAFALGVLALLGKRVPPALKVFLAALAIVDDLGAVLVIALFYTERAGLGALGLAATFLAGLGIEPRGLAQPPRGLRRARCRAVVGVLTSGVHATVAGVLVALMVPTRVRLVPTALASVLRRGADRVEEARLDASAEERSALIARLERVLQESQSPALRFEHAVQPWVTLAIMPVFALFNAGLRFDAEAARTLTSPVATGVLGGLILGKPLGIFLASWIAVKTGLAALPGSTSWRHVFGAACLAGIGFTMSLFISSLAFAGSPLEAEAKLGILLASLVSAAAGSAVLLTAPRAETGEQAAGPATPSSPSTLPAPPPRARA